MKETEKKGSKKEEEDKKKKQKEDELSEEDQKLQEQLNMLVERLSEPDEKLYRASLEVMRDLIRASTTSMTSVPKPLKFMMTHFESMTKIHDSIKDVTVKKFCADVISALAMTREGTRECLKYRLLGQLEPISDWGHEYVRHLSSELGEQWKEIDPDSPEGKGEQKKLLLLAREIVEHNMKHSAEAEACDLLLEIEQLSLLTEFVEEPVNDKVCLYLLSCVPYAPDEENQTLVRTSMELYLKFGKEIEALRCALMLNDMGSIKRIFLGCENANLQKQMALLLGRHQIFLEIPEDNRMVDELTELNSNSQMFTYFQSLGRELDIMEPKKPEDIYKTHLEPTNRFSSSTTQPDSARMNLAATFVNGFVNTGFGTDKLVTGEGPEAGNQWFYKNKDYGMLSAAASQGLIFRWDLDNGLAHCDKFLYANEKFIKAGSMLAVGIISSGIHHDCDPAEAILLDYVKPEYDVLFRTGAIFGLGLAYANSKRVSVTEGTVPQLLQVLQEENANSEIQGLAGLSLGLIRVGTGEADTAAAIWQCLMEKGESALQRDNNLRFLALGIGLIYLGKQEDSSVMVESLRALPNPFGAMAATLLDVCAYAGTGNVLKIQELLHICSEHYEQAKDKDEKKKTTDSSSTKKDEKGGSKTAGDQGSKGPVDLSIQQSVAVLGIALIAMGEDVGSAMSFRMMGHLLRYGEPVIRRAVPLALGLLSVSNPQLNILETLSKFSHDSDAETAYNSIFALGLVGAGTNNARLGSMLRQLAVYHAREPQHLMLVRIAQGMTHMGKGTMTLSPFHSDRQLMCPAAVAGLLATCFSFLDVKNTILGQKQHYLLYCLVPAIQPRQLITFLAEEDDAGKPLQQINVPVRVGQAVDVVGQAGKPKTITGFQTHTTPVLLAYGERAELATEEYLSVTPYLEGLVILKRNPEYQENVSDIKKK